MEVAKIRYKEGYKYQLHDDYNVQIHIRPAQHILFDGWIKLTDDGLLTISKGYAWDGPSGPCIDTKNFMRGSLVHDALYQLMREGFLDTDTYRLQCDFILDTILKEDGMSSIRRWWVRTGLYIGGRPAADKQDEVVLEAP